MRLSRQEKAQHQNDFSGYRDDPVAFVVDVLGAQPWERQAQILQGLAREPRITVRSCNNAGKTICAAWAALWFLYSRPGSIVVTTAPTENQVVNLLWRRLRSAFAGSKSPLPGRCLTKMLEVTTESYAMGLATDKEVNFQGPHSPHGVLMIGDEASGLEEWVFNAMRGAMTEAGAKMLLIGNPNSASGTFFESHRKWEVSQRFHIDAFEVPEHILRPDWKEEMLAELGETSPVYQVRVLGNFPEQGEDSLISIAWVEAAQEREIEPTESDKVELGVDVARYGADESVAYVRRGNAVVDFAAWRGNDTMASAGRVAALIRQWAPVHCVKVDDIGVGAGVVDRLQEEFRGNRAVQVIGVNVGEAAWDPENYANRRAEIFQGLADRFKSGDISIPKNDTILLDQLTQLRYSYTPRGQKKIESKDDMRKRRGGAHGWQSPDRADALALAFAVVQQRPLMYVGVGVARDVGKGPLG